MQFGIRRAWGCLILIALLAVPTTTVRAAGTTTTPTVHRTTRSSVHHRRVRRAPPGGVYARSAIVLDPVTNQVLFEKNADRSVPIASLTKLMTTMVFLDQKPDLQRVVEVTRDEIAGGGHTQLRNHEQVSLGDLLHMSLMCSDNVATRVLARESGLPADAFVERMNQKSSDLGLSDSHFVEFTGLDESNVSTAADVARMLRAAADNAMIRSITTTRSYAFQSGRRVHFITNTNRLLYGRYEILGGKTGHISEAGYCLATWVRSEGRDLIAVVLGAPTNATRFADVVRLVQRTTTPTVAQTQP